MHKSFSANILIGFLYANVHIIVKREVKMAILSLILVIVAIVIYLVSTVMIYIYLKKSGEKVVNFFLLKVTSSNM